MTMSCLTWRPILGFEGLYEVSNLGQVRSLDRIVQRSRGAGYVLAGRVLSPGRGDNGYLRVCLYGRGPMSTRYIHRLVLEAFVGPCPEGMEGCHWDNDRTHNAIENLRWDTRPANHADKRRHGTNRGGGRSGETHHNAKLTASQVGEIRARYAAGGVTQRELGEEYGVDRRTVSVTVRRDAWRSVA